MASTNNEMSKEDAAQPPRDESIETLRGDGQSCVVGYELDELVAKEVMGYIRVLSLGDWAWRRRGSDDLPHSVPHYSQYVTHAMEVVEKMRGEGWSFACTHYEGKLPYASFCKRTAASSRNAEADTLPEAICRAALAAVAHNEEK